ncbi:hypothetical protein [Burkholderia anthina]|uniref:hypothetical protein n=1 Tax=Burkholderia anthina TaxID=179879 RepID=UPI001FC7EC1A|nr:hypothetical protein [Burkholderia anthina]
MATYTKRGGVWCAPVRRKGVSLSETFSSKADAVAWATKTEHEINVGKVTPSTKHTFADALREYEKRVRPTKRTAHCAMGGDSLCRLHQKFPRPGRDATVVRHGRAHGSMA